MAFDTQSYERRLAAAVDAHDERTQSDVLDDWGLALVQEAQRLEGPEADSLLDEAIEKYETATETDPTYSSPWRNWGDALLKKAAAVVDLPAARELMHAAHSVFENGLQAVKGDATAELDLLNDWGLALFAEAKLIDGTEAGPIFDRAIEKYRAAIEAVPTSDYPWRNWAFVLQTQASLADLPTARKLLRDTYAIHQKALAAMSDKNGQSGVLNAWGLTLVAEADRLAGEEATALYDQAIIKFRAATEANRSDLYPWRNWGDSLKAKALKKGPVEARQLLQEAYAKYDQAVMASADDPAGHSGSLTAWGIALVAEAQRTRGEEAHGLLDTAIEKYKAAIEADRSNEEPRRMLGDALLTKASTVDVSAARELLREVYGIYEKALAAVTGNADAQSTVLVDWGIALITEAERVKPDEATVILEQAIDKCGAAIKANPRNRFAWWNSALALCQKARRAGFAGAADLYSRARKQYETAVELTPRDDQRAEIWSSWASRVRDFATLDKEEAVPFVDHAAKHLRQAVAKNSQSAATYLFDLGSLFREADSFDEAIDALRDGAASGVRDLEAVYCQHNLASMFDDQGLYVRARKEWNETRRRYAQYIATGPMRADDPDLCGYYGSALFDVFGELDEAEKHLRDAVALGASYAADFEFWLTKLSKEKADIDVTLRPQFYARARHCERTIRNSASDEAGKSYLLGKLSLVLDDYGVAERHLQESIKLNPYNAETHEALGLALLKQQKHRRALHSLQEAHRLAPRSLSISCRLGDALAKSGDTDGAERQYTLILDIANENVDAHLGLAELALSAGDETADVESYEQAVTHLTEVILLSAKKRGSRRLTKKELAQAHYSRGYAQVKVDASAGRFSTRDRIPAAIDDFRRARKLDCFHLKARRAHEKLLAATPPGATKAVTSGVVGLVLVASAVIFSLAQLSFWQKAETPYMVWGYAFPLHGIAPVTHFALTFGALAFFIVALSFPRLLKLKVAGVELERSPLDVGGAHNVSLRR